jgi:acetylornithine aminotransferase
LPLINFGIGDPRERTPEFVRQTLRAAVPEVSSYPATAGLPELRAAAAGWLGRRFGVRVDPDRELLPVNGTKEGVFLLALAVVSRDAARRTVVIPTPAYPVYEPSARFAGADVHEVPLRSEDGWRFDPSRVPDEVWRRTALLWLNVPHNPTGATLDRPALAAIAELARRHGFWVGADEAYADVWFDAPPPSMLECGTDNVIAFHTLSKRSAMTGYRSGFMAGDARLMAALGRFRPNVGVATPEFVQRAAIAAWSDDAHAEAQRRVYAAKRERVAGEFRRRGWVIEASEATFYLWTRAPGGDDVAWVEGLLRRGIQAMPGSFLSPAGAGFMRWALVPTLEQCAEAMARLDSSADGVSG